MTITSLEQCYQIADNLADSGACPEGREAINFASFTAQMYRRHVKSLAWACLEKNRQKRMQAIELALMELDAAGESTAELPMRAYLKS